MSKITNYSKPSASILNKRLKQQQDVTKERNKLALQSFKDIFSILNPNANDDDDFDVKDFDPSPFYANPKAFQELPFFKQQYIIDELNDKLKKNWRPLDQNMKRFSYWLAYGSYGPREGFPDIYDYFNPMHRINENENRINKSGKNNTKKHTRLDDLVADIANNTSQTKSEKSAIHLSSNDKNQMQLNKQVGTPPDLPFKVPSILQTFKPNKKSIIHRLPTLDPRSFGLKRLQQYQQDRRMNPINKIILVILVFLTVLNFKKDRRVNVSGIAPEYPWEQDKLEEIKDDLSIKLQESIIKNSDSPTEKDSKIDGKKDKKWYYLWLF